jgi:hypothetical protein
MHLPFNSQGSNISQGLGLSWNSRSQEETMLLRSNSARHSISTAPTRKDDFSDDENLLNTLRIKNPSNTTSSSSQDGNLSTEEQYDIQLGVATLVPLCHAPVRRILIPPRGVGLMEIVTSGSSEPQFQRETPQVPPRSKRNVEVEGEGKTVGMGESVGWKEEVGVRGGGEEEEMLKLMESVTRIAPESSPPPPPCQLRRRPPQVPPRPKRKVKPAPVNTSLPPPYAEVGEKEEVPHLPEKRVKKAVLPPPPLSLFKRSPPGPAPSTTPPIRFPEPTRSAPDQLLKRLGVVFTRAPVPERISSKSAELSSISNLDSASLPPPLSTEAGHETAAETSISVSGNWNLGLMRRMYSDCLAGRGRFLPSRLRLEARIEAMKHRDVNWEEEAEEVYRKQWRFFKLADDGEGFRDPFVEMGISEGDLEEVLGMGVSPKTKVKVKGGGRREGSVERALGDESLHGLMVSPKIVGRDADMENFLTAGTEEAATATAELATGEALPGKERGAHEYMFDSWSSISLEDGNAEGDEGVEEQNEIINLFAGQSALPGNAWTAPLAWRSESGSSNYSAPSQPPSPVPNMRQGGTLSYPPLQNPWTTAFDSLSARSRFQHAANEIFSGFDVDALVASTQEPGYELADSNSGKESPEIFHLKPHKPKRSCGCEFCYRHFNPTLEILKTHDPSEWCHCSACRDFRDNRDMEKNRAEQNAAWRARLNELATEVDDARAEEESRLLDLPNFREEDNQEEFKPKKSHRLGDWVRSHLRNPSPRE